MASYLLFVTLVALMAGPLAFANDPNPLQDFCVADLQSNIFVNGFVCKNPKQVTPNDFFFSGLDKPGNTMNFVGSAVTPVSVLQDPGLNTLGVSLARLDFAPNGGLNPPHTHPRATEVLVVMEGTLDVAFVTSNPDNRLFEKILRKGDVYVFPEGLIHFQINRGRTPAVAISGFSSQNPGVITVFNALFRSNPPISDDVLEKTFRLNERTVDRLQGQSGNNY